MVRSGACPLNLGSMYNTRLDGLTEYPFQRLTSLLGGITPAGSSGANSVNMSIGEPQHTPPALLYSALDRHRADWGKYPPTAGSPDFRAAVGAWCNQRYGLPAGFLDPERHILPVAGSREGLFMAAQLCTPPQKAGHTPTLLMPNPFYQVYFGAAVMHGADPVYVAAEAATGFQPDYSSVAKADLDRAAAAYLCTPANPQGAVASLAQLKSLIHLARAHDFVLISDECYSEIYGDSAPAGALAACAALGDGLANVLVFNSLSKRSSVPGLRSGFVAGDADLIAKFARLRAHGGAVQPLPVIAASAALWRDETHVEESRALYRAKIEDAAKIFGNQFGFYRPAGGFFLWLDVGDGEVAAKRLWSEAGIRVLPGAYLARAGGDGKNPGQPYIRVALVHDRAVTTDALMRMKTVLGST